MVFIDIHFVYDLIHAQIELLFCYLRWLLIIVNAVLFVYPDYLKHFFGVLLEVLGYDYFLGTD